MSNPIVAIVGRPNVGKSTLFNRLVGQRLAITAEAPGTTRDRLIANIEWHGSRFAIVDTAGLDARPEDFLHEKMMSQVGIAIEDADAIVFMVDITQGITAADADVADVLRKAGKPLVLVANKSDNPKRELGAPEFHSLGLGVPVPVSAYHNWGVGDLLDQVVERIPQAEQEEMASGMRLAIVGRPNVGKSMLLNAVLGQERVLVSEIPGTTRDSIDTILTSGEERITLIDTAGIRRRGRVQPGIEKFSTMRAVRAIERADIALLLLDAAELVTAQDVHVGGYVLDAYKGLIIIVNKWDLAEGLELTERDVEREIRSKFRFAPFAPVLFTSALQLRGLPAVLDTARRIYEQRSTRVGTGELNRVIDRAAGEHLPRLVGKRRLHLLYATQASVNPPTFVFFVNDPKLLHFAYQRYLDNRIRENFGFSGTPLRFVFKGRGEN